MTESTADLARLHDRLADLRAFLVERWVEYGEKYDIEDAGQGRDMCLLSSCVLVKLLGAPWQVAGGAADFCPKTRTKFETGGFFDGKLWHGHYWITDGQMIVDLTASQFGSDEIIVTQQGDARYLANYTAEDMVRFVRAADERSSDWVDWYRETCRAPASDAGAYGW